MKLSDYVVKFLEDKGIEHIFMLSGGGCLHLVDSVGKSNLKYVCNLHEQAVAIAGEAYAQYTNKPSVCLVTTGPGGTNTITGVASAWLDSIPMIMISGQVQSKDMKGLRRVRQIGFQEIDIVSIVKPITKYAKIVKDPNQIRTILETAYRKASTGRQGPVWIDIPLDVQAAMIDPDQICSSIGPIPYKKDLELVKKHQMLFYQKDVKEILQLIEESKRPIILAGNGIRSANAIDKFHQLIDKLQIPVLTTWKGIDLLEEDHPLFVGRPGIAAHRGANFSQQNADLFISIGARLDHGQTAFNHENFAKKAKKVIVDIDDSEIDKMGFDIDYPIHDDAGDFIDAMLTMYHPFSLPERGIPPHLSWLKQCKQWQANYPVYLPEYFEQKYRVNNYAFIETLSNLMSPTDLLIPGSSGACSEITMQAFKVKKGQRIFNSEGLGSMGFGIAAAIGGCIASDRRHTICVDGDGGFIMNVQELETIHRLNLPIKFFVLNNSGYVSIRNSQDKHFEQRVASSEETGVTLPYFHNIAQSYRISYQSIYMHPHMEEIINKVLQAEGPVICEIHMLHTQETFPRTSTKKNEDGSFSSAPMEDLYPFLDREEFESNMLNE